MKFFLGKGDTPYLVNVKPETEPRPKPETTVIEPEKPWPRL
jgi:hypothetical protein